MANLVRTTDRVVAVQQAMTNSPPIKFLMAILGEVLASYLCANREDIQKEYQKYWKVDEDLKKAVVEAADNRFETNTRLGVTAEVRIETNDEPGESVGNTDQTPEQFNVDFLSRYGLKYNFTTVKHLKNAFVRSHNNNTDTDALLKLFYENNGVASPDANRIDNRKKEILVPMETAVTSIRKMWSGTNNAQEKKAQARNGRMDTGIVTQENCRMALAGSDYKTPLEETPTPSNPVFFHFGLLCCSTEAELKKYAPLMGRCMIGENIHMGALKRLVVKNALHNYFEMAWHQRTNTEPANLKQVKTWSEWLEKAAKSFDKSIKGLDLISAFWISLARTMQVWDAEMDRVRMDRVRAKNKSKEAVPGANASEKQNHHLCDRYFNKRSEAWKKAHAEEQADQSARIN